jgi:putative ABC transport system permease protein
MPLERMFVVVRAERDPLAFSTVVRTDVGALDPTLAAPDVRTFDDVLMGELALPRQLTGFISGFAAVALVLAGVGLFGLLSFGVAQRKTELGIRLALGASPLALVQMVMRQASLLVGVGLLLGLAGAFAMTRVMANLLFEISPIDPLAVAAVAVALGVTGLLASLVPAWRAASIDPLAALRCE